tara:strand:- start:59 stop:400 length:342 start_codon:yes stop_codon:yes gene_type:complete
MGCCVGVTDGSVEGGLPPAGLGAKISGCCVGVADGSAEGPVGAVRENMFCQFAKTVYQSALPALAAPAAAALAAAAEPRLGKAATNGVNGPASVVFIDRVEIPMVNFGPGRRI